MSVLNAEKHFAGKDNAENSISDSHEVSPSHSRDWWFPAAAATERAGS